MGRIWNALTKGRIDGVIVIDGKTWIHREPPWYRRRLLWRVGAVAVALLLSWIILGCDPVSSQHPVTCTPEWACGDSAKLPTLGEPK